jgi:hypothetical protein
MDITWWTLTSCLTLAAACCCPFAGTAANISLQLVLLPPYASDVSPETPAQQVIELQHDVTVRKSLQNGSSVYIIGGRALRRSQPVQEHWHLRGKQPARGVGM